MANHTEKSKSKKLKPACVAAQKAWQKFPAKLKKELRKSLPDTDKDRVPDGFDCRPRDRKKQESFLDDDAAYLNSNQEIRLGKLIGRGCEGDVYGVAGNRNLVVKVPNGTTSLSVLKTSSAKRMRCQVSEELVNDEAKFYAENGLYGKPLFIPMKRVTINGSYYEDGWARAGLVKPKVKPVVDFTKSVPSRNLRSLTDAQLEATMQQLLELTYEGFAFEDGLQVGIDRTGRLLIYDTGKMKKYPPGSDQPFFVNDRAWWDFLRHIGKDVNSVSKYRRKYSGIVKPEWVGKHG